MEEALQAKNKRLVNAAVMLFAFIGFLASSITVYQFTFPKGESSISVTIWKHKFLTPTEVSGEMQSGAPGRTLMSNLRSTICSKQNQDELILQDIKEIERKPLKPKDISAQLNCKSIMNAEFSARWSGEYSSDLYNIFEYEITNNGRNVAKDIRLPSENINAIQIQRTTGSEVKKLDSESYYKLPDLNPKESIRILVWSSQRDINSDYSPFSNAPKLTFAGSEVQMTYMRLVPEGWFSVYDVLSSVPLVIAVIIVVGVSLFMLLAVVLAISVVSAIVSGKPISSVFRSPEDKILENQTG